MSKGLGQKIAIKFTEDLVDVIVPVSIPDGKLNLPNNIFSVSTNDGLLFSQLSLSAGSDNDKYYLAFNIDLTNHDELSVQAFMEERSWITAAIWINEDLVFSNAANFELQTIDIDVSNYNSATIKLGLFTRNNEGIKGVVGFKNLTLDGEPMTKVAYTPNAFTVTGKEYQYVNGPLIDGNYLVERVEKKGVNNSLETDVNGVAEFIIDTNIVGIDYSELEWSIAAQGYIPKTGIENDLTEEVLIEVVLERNQLPNIEGLVLHLDATDHASIINEPTIPQTIKGLVLHLDATDHASIINEPTIPKQ